MSFIMSKNVGHSSEKTPRELKEKFIVLFAINCTNPIKSNYLNSHGEEAQEKPPGLQISHICNFCSFLWTSSGIFLFYALHCY